MPVITHEDILSLPQADEVFRGGEDAVLNKVCTTRMIAVQDIDKLKKNKSIGPEEIFSCVPKKARYTVSGTLASITKKSFDS